MFAVIGLLEIGFLVFLGDLPSMPAAPRRWLGAAALLYGSSAILDMLEPEGLYIRLALEDLPKTWGGVCLFLFAWGLFDRAAAEHPRRS